jgi:hypothetical protein
LGGSSEDEDDQLSEGGCTPTRDHGKPQRSSSPNDAYRKSKANKGNDYKRGASRIATLIAAEATDAASIDAALFSAAPHLQGGNKGKQTTERKEVTLRCSKIVKRTNIKMASWDGDTFGMCKVLYDHDNLSSSYSSLAARQLQAN